MDWLGFGAKAIRHTVLLVPGDASGRIAASKQKLLYRQLRDEDELES